MSTDKRALDELDALFRAVPAKAAPFPRPAKKIRKAGDSISLSASKRGDAANESTIMADEPKWTYTLLPPALLPLALRAAPSGPRGGKSKNVGAAAAMRLAAFVRGALGARGERAASAAIESKLQKRVVHLENASTQTAAQSAGVRAARKAASSRQGLSGKQCKKMGLDQSKTREGGSFSFRDLLSLHGVWKGYAERVVSQCRSNERVLQQRILAADLQGCYLTVSQAAVPSLVNVAGIVLRETANTFELVTPEGKTKTIPKRACAVRLAFGGLVVNLSGTALEGRRGRRRADRGKKDSPLGVSDDGAAFPTPTMAL